jgi:hypothetical protein
MDREYEERVGSVRKEAHDHFFSPRVHGAKLIGWKVGIRVSITAGFLVAAILGLIGARVAAVDSVVSGRAVLPFSNRVVRVADGAEVLASDGALADGKSARKGDSIHFVAKGKSVEFIAPENGHWLVNPSAAGGWNLAFAPTPVGMVVPIRIGEAEVDRVRVGQRCVIRLDGADRNEALTGTVADVDRVGVPEKDRGLTFSVAIAIGGVPLSRPLARDASGVLQVVYGRRTVYDLLVGDRRSGSK